MMCIVMTAQQADEVRGATSGLSALDPILLADGSTWVLPERVLEDNKHASAWEALAVLPVRDVAPSEFVQPE